MKPPRVEIERDVWLDGRRALWLAAARCLVVADLHWGYAESHRVAGNLLPAWGDDELVRGLDALVEDYAPAEMVWLGDVTHASAGRAHASHYLARCSVPIVVLGGNHDRGWKVARREGVLPRQGFRLHHGDQPFTHAGPERELVGHFHPAALLADGAGTRLKLPALVTGPRRWIMPAFSPWAAGVPWNRHLRREEQLWALAARRILRLPPSVPAGPRS